MNGREIIWKFLKIILKKIFKFDYVIFTWQIYENKLNKNQAI